MTNQDIEMMGRALALAERGLFTTTPNPRVGCVIVRDGQVVGEGWHQRAGEAHAEVIALGQAGELARGATAYITLEPCCHQGRTGPCTEALLAAGISEVVVAMEDPNPLVAGQGMARLRAAGLSVRLGPGQQQAAALNPGFIKRMQTGLPWIRVKTAISLDGRTALPSGISQWITDPASRADGHAWRARACVVATGLGTFQRDQPLLTVRGVETPRQPRRLLLDAGLEADPTAPFFREPDAWVACSLAPDQPGFADRLARLEAVGARVLFLPSQTGEPGGRINLWALAERLGSEGCNELHLEAGGRLAGAFGLAGLIDEWLIYQAPIFLGEGLGPMEPAPPLPLTRPEAAARWRLVEMTAVGDGQRLRLLKA